MRKAGDILEGNTQTQAIMRQAINSASDSFAPEVVQQISSHHVDLNSGRVGFINDGDPTSTIYKDGKKLQGEFESLRMPLQGQPYGAKELRDMSPTEFEKYERIFDAQYQHGTGNLV